VKFNFEFYKPGFTVNYAKILYPKEGKTDQELRDIKIYNDDVADLIKK